MQDKPLNIVILGGGTAGWMAANYMIHQWADKNINITLVESPDIGIVGVGEGSTPSLKNFFDDVGITESEWMPQCNATYKVGIRFDGWSSVKGFESYNHPFPNELDRIYSAQFAQNCKARRLDYDVEVHPDQFFLQSLLGSQQKSPVSTSNFPFDTAYGYHFDSGLLGQFLAKIAKQRGVNHVQARMLNTNLHENGNIGSLTLDNNPNNNQTLKADFFIDCSGFRSVLLQQALGVKFESFAKNLFNDAAVVMPTPAGKTLNSITISTAMTNGWAWDIPLTNRTGNGYVYSSQYSSADDAETELRAKLNLLDSPIEARHLKMKVGRVAKHWHKNVLGIGLSQGFIEPLEATALHIVQVSILEFMLNFEAGNFTHQFQDKYNDIINRRFESVRDYIVAHYRLNSRANNPQTDSQYWRDNSQNQNLSNSLIHILNSWTGGLKHDIDIEINRQNIGQYFPVDSWRILLAGYGFFPSDQATKSGTEIPHNVDVKKIQHKLFTCTQQFLSQQDALKKLAKTTKEPKIYSR